MSGNVHDFLARRILLESQLAGRIAGALEHRSGAGSVPKRADAVYLAQRSGQGLEAHRSKLGAGRAGAAKYWQACGRSEQARLARDVVECWSADRKQSASTQGNGGQDEVALGGEVMQQR